MSEQAENEAGGLKHPWHARSTGMIRRDARFDAAIEVAISALRQAGQFQKADVLSAHRSADLSSAAAVVDLHEHVEDLVWRTYGETKTKLESFLNVVRGHVFAHGTRGFARHERDAKDREYSLAENIAPRPARESRNGESATAVVIDLGVGPGLGKHVLPSWPEERSGEIRFCGFPWACTIAARKYLNDFTAIVAEHRGLSASDAWTVRAWADEFFVIDCYRKKLSSMTTTVAALETIVEICFNHTTWSLHRESFERELNEARLMLRAAREGVKAR